MVVLGVLAAVVPLSQLSPLTHAIWVFVFCSLGALEIAVIVRDAEQRNKQFLQERHTQNMQVSRILESVVEIPRTTAALLQSQVDVDKATQAHLPPDSPKRRVLALAQDILRFLAARQVAEPRLPRSETWEADTEAMIRHSRETMARYLERFQVPVASIRHEFANQGVTNKKLEDYYEYPTNPLGVQAVAEGLIALAEQLPDTPSGGDVEQRNNVHDGPDAVR